MAKNNNAKMENEGAWACRSWFGDWPDPASVRYTRQMCINANPVQARVKGVLRVTVVPNGPVRKVKKNVAFK